MPLPVQKAGWTLEGWMSFTVPNGGHLRLGKGTGQAATKPTLAASRNKIETDLTCFLVNGIPQNRASTDFAKPVVPDDANGHGIKHAIITVISAGAVITPAARTMTDTTIPDATHGQYVAAPDQLIIENGRTQLWNFDLINLSGGNEVVEVLVYS